jgi:transcriptional regulator GlxA family with amidase domain
VKEMRETRLMVLVTSEGAQALDVVGPADVFSAANAIGASPEYKIEFASAQGGLIQMSNGLKMMTRPAASIRTPAHTVMVGGTLFPNPQTDPLVRKVAQLARRAIRVTSVCTGAFVLAEAGLLDGRNATTHWSACRRLARQYPHVTVLDERIYVRDGDVWTSAGVTAGMDLALALVEADHGQAVAREVAKWLVVYLQRPGGQSQFSFQTASPAAGAPSVEKVVEWINDNLANDCSVERLADVGAMSVRHLTRVFTEEVGDPPARFVQVRRLEEARVLLETTTLDLTAVTKRVGFQRLETLHRGFRERFGVTPTQHRALFGRAGASGRAEHALQSRR